jgi:carbon-monoxide dehydrogenase medium subunit
VAELAGASGTARVLAGGTDLLVQLRAGMIEPDLVVDIKGIDETRTITRDGDGYRVGAAVAGAELTEHPDFPKAWPGVAESFDLIGSTQIQGRASMGGNLCNASPAADSVPALIAASATCTLAGPDGRREVAVEDICTGPGQTSLKPGEFLVSFFLPPRAKHSSDAYLRFIPRTEMDIAVVGAGVNLTLDDGGNCIAARVALGAVAPTARLVADAGAALQGSSLDDAALEKMAAAARAACSPIDDKRGTVEYRIHVAGVLAIRAAKIALERAKEN